MMEKQLYNRQYFFIMKISKKNIMYDCVFHTVERSSCMCKKTKEQKFIMLPSVDFCFQELMEDEEVRRGFIGAFLRIPPEEILDMELLPKKLRKKYKEEKYGILDVRVRLREGEQLNIEMQSIAYDYWQERSLFYLGKMYVDQIHEGEDYDKLKKCIHVGILDFTLFEHERYYSCFHIWEDTIRDMYSDKFEIHVLELPKLAKYEYPQTELLRWAQFFGARSREEIEVLAEKYEYIHKAYDKLEEISADEEKRLEYEERQKAIRDHRHMLASGRREGLREGLREGKHEHAVEMARKMLEDKLPIEKIAEYSGLSPEDVHRLEEQ